MLQRRMLMEKLWSKYADLKKIKKIFQIYTIYKTYVQKLHVMKYVKEIRGLLLRFQVRLLLQKYLSRILKRTSITRNFPLIKSSY